MPTAWLILMNSRLSGLVQRLMKRDPSRTKSLGISASSWKVSDIVKELKIEKVKESGREEEETRRKERRKEQSGGSFRRGRSHPGHFHFWGIGELVYPTIRPSFSNHSGASTSFQLQTKSLAGLRKEEKEKRIDISPLWCLTQIFESCY